MLPKNHTKEALAGDGWAFGARSNSFSPDLVEVYGELGLDFVWLDIEHGGPSAEDATGLEHLVRAATVADVDLMVRLPSNDPSVVRKVLDTGVRTVVVPRVETAADVRRAARAAFYTYDGGPGERGVAHARGSSWGADLDTDREDGSVLVGAMIENRTAVENIEEILSVPGVGFAYLGPGDLAVSMGHPGESDHPDVREVTETAREACVDAGVPIGVSVTGIEGAEAALDAGHRIVRLGDEMEAVRELVGGRLDAVRERG
ncbi:MAG: aldolase/citrate lyase family protein [Haloarculaceae archaeon]